MELEADISEEEVWDAIKALPSDKAPSSDGFTGAFYKLIWPTIKPEIMAVIQAFAHTDNRSMSRLNNALIVLLPKKVGAASLGDFWPITMIHSFAKLVSKILALCLAPRMDEIITKNQNAFIRNRNIQDNFKYIQQAAVLIRKKKVPMLLLKA